MHIPRTTVQAKSHRFKSPAILIYLMVSAGMGAVFITIFLGLPWVVSIVALVGPMFLIIGLTAGKTEYIIDVDFLEKKLVTFLREKRIDRKYTWNEITSFKEGKDMNRSYEEYSFIEINFKDWTTWQITDQVDKAGFEKFREVFLQAVQQRNEPATETNSAQATVAATQVSAASQSANKPQAATANHLIIQKKTLYETVWAKVFFWAMALFVSGIWGFLLVNPQYRSFTTGFRITFVIIPGLLYLYYRIYIKRK